MVPVRSLINAFAGADKTTSCLLPAFKQMLDKEMSTSMGELWCARVGKSLPLIPYM